MPYYTVTCGLCVSTTFFQIISLMERFLENKYATQNVCLVFPTALSAAFLILRINQRDININAHRSSCQVAVIVTRLQTCIFTADFRKILKFQIS